MPSFAKIKPYVMSGISVLVVLALVAHFAPESFKSKVRI